MRSPWLERFQFALAAIGALGAAEQLGRFGLTEAAVLLAVAASLAGMTGATVRANRLALEFRERCPGWREPQERWWRRLGR